MSVKPKKPDPHAATKQLLKAVRGLIDAQRINTDKLNNMQAILEDWQQSRHLDHIDQLAGLPTLEPYWEQDE